MKVLVSWLRDFVDVPGTPEEIAATMSVRGFAVEGIEPVEDVSSRSAEGASADLSRRSGEGAKADAILDFEITANRPDCMSVIGIAREVATAYGLQARRPAAGSSTLNLVSLKDAGGAAGQALDVVIDNPDLGPRYVGAIADVTVGPSPDWMQARLRAAGVRPISNIVDITNYVLLELGQPMHAFDYTLVGGAQIRVRTARAGETLKTLDGQTRELSPDMLVIADMDRPIAVAGVMGGANSEVSAETRTIVFESAYFNPLSVRRTSRKLGLKTEASMRFERGADPRLPVTAMERACALLEQIGAGRARGTMTDRYPARIEPAALRLRRARVAGLIGIPVPDADIKRILDSLGFALHDAADGWDVTVPTRRVDILREVDLIEEVARHYGFDRVPVRFPAVVTAPPRVDPRITRARQLRSVMTGAGFSEAVTFGFVGEAVAAPFAAQGDLVAIKNPLSDNFAVLRPSALPGLLDAVAHNRHREQRDIRLFEIGNRFTTTTGERRALACAWTGMVGGDHWAGAGRTVDFFDMKGVVERISSALGLDSRTESHQEPWLVPGRAAAVMAAGERIGVLGQIAPAVAERHGLDPGVVVYIAEVDLDAADRLSADAIHMEPLPKYPSVTRDISIVVEDTLPAAAIRRTVRDAAPPTLVRVREFDRYQGKGVPDGKVSLSLRLTFRSPERTLTDSEVQNAMERVLAALREAHGAVQR
jgi:phenylalanyl-tRNA synthetase beta chain